MTTRDAQRARVYRWESRCVGNGTVPISALRPLNLMQCQQWVDAVWHAENGAGATPLVKRARSDSGNAYARFADNVITLPEGMRCKQVCAHEVAHMLTKECATLKGGLHGPRFVKRYIKLLVDYLQADRTALLAAASEEQVTVEAA